MGDASEFANKLEVCGTEVDGHRILRTNSAAVPNAIAAFMMHLRNTTEKIPHVYFSWTEGNPAVYLLKYLFMGAGDVPPVTREILRQAEPDPDKRPTVHVSG